MKVISIGPAHPLRGGISRFNESFSLSLIKTGIDIELVSFHYLYPRLLFPGKTQFTISHLPEGLVIHTLIYPLNPLSWKKVVARIIEARPDLVVFHYWMPFFAPAYGMIARGIKHKLQVKMIAITHNLIPHEKQPCSISFTRFFLKPIDGVITLSSSVLRDLKTLIPGKKGIFLPHPVYDIFGEKKSREESLAKLGLDKKFRYLLFFGLVRDYKGLDILLSALNYVKSDNYMLLVAGEFYNNKEKYLSLIAANNLDDRVIIRDEYIPDEEVKYYFSVADLVVQPYKSATQSGVTQMAYHFDCPMLVSSVGGLPELVPHHKAGYVVNPNSREIAKAIDEFLSLEDKNEFVSFIQEEKKKYSWSNFIEKFTKFSGTL